LKSKVFLAVFLIVLALIFIGCATGSAVVDDFSKVIVTAMGVPEGIQIIFESIPEETNLLYVSLHDATENYEIMSYVNIFDDELEVLKNDGNLICPFTKKGHVYRISIHYFSQDSLLPDDIINVAATARGGYYPELVFDVQRVHDNLVWAIGVPKKVESIALF